MMSLAKMAAHVKTWSTNTDANALLDLLGTIVREVIVCAFCRFSHFLRVDKIAINDYKT